MLQPLLHALAPHWDMLGAASYFLIRIWLLKRQRRWQKKHLELEQRRHIASQNETLKIALTAFAQGAPPTLDDLLSKREADFSLRSSETPSEREPPSDTRREDSYLRTRPR
jgi:hypothetical protein